MNDTPQGENVTETSNATVGKEVVPVTDKSRLTGFSGGPWRHQFGQHSWVLYTPPRDTCDPRYVACVDHHVACDCREAEFAENLTEYRWTVNATREAFNDVLAGHHTYDYTRPETQCRCTGCQIARLAYIYPTTTR